jgi:hypothetical protein
MQVLCVFIVKFIKHVVLHLTSLPIKFHLLEFSYSGGKIRSVDISGHT